MTERYEGFIVILEKEKREDCVQETVNAISQIKGVLKVTPLVANPETYCAYERGIYEMRKKFFESLKLE